MSAGKLASTYAAMEDVDFGVSAAGIAVPGGPGQFHKNDQRWPVHSSAGL